MQGPLSVRHSNRLQRADVDLVKHWVIMSMQTRRSIVDKPKENLKKELVNYFVSENELDIEDLTDEYFESALESSLEVAPITTPTKGPKV